MKNFKNYFLFYHTYLNFSITKAAENLNVTKSTVSRAISQIESNYGLKLFYRNGKGLHSTRFGDHLFQYCDKIFGLFKEIENSSAKFKDDCCGTIKILAPVLFGQTLLSPIISRFCCQFPDARFHVCLSDDLAESNFPNYDIVFSTNDKISESFHVKKVGSIYTKLFWSRAYIDLDLNNFENNNFIILTSKCIRDKFILKVHSENSNDTKSYEVHPKIISNDSRIVKEATINGLGIGILPGHEVSYEVTSGKVEELFENKYVYNDDIFAIYSGFVMMPKLFKAFLNFADVELSIDLQINKKAYTRNASQVSIASD